MITLLLVYYFCLEPWILEDFWQSYVAVMFVCVCQYGPCFEHSLLKSEFDEIAGIPSRDVSLDDIGKLFSGIPNTSF